MNIAYDELEKYPEDTPPVCVEYQFSLMNKVEEGTSVFDSMTADGVDNGPCPFVVHGVTGTQLATKTVAALKGIALKHWNNKGAALSMSHAAEPQSIYNNPNLYPQIFPWLFPYGLGGIGNGTLSEKAHKEFLLMYYDKRFQWDIAFPFVAFSHEQIKATTTGAFLLTERAKFKVIAEWLLNVNQEVLADIGKCMSEGETVRALTADEKMCFQIIKDLDHVSGKVKGSITSKKYMHNEIWSLIVALGAPLWYITLSLADNKHHICLYFAGHSQSFCPWPLSADKRYWLIAENPVAGALFFHFMTTMFIKHVLEVGTAHSRVYGNMSGYYGTVEQQGCLTLHLHMLLVRATL